jgi:glycosyltransferase involved in cell wall biosynthesis
MNYPPISILIPCRNEELFISGCVTSLLNQDYPSEKVEILIVDGNSTDGSLRIIDKIVKKNLNVHLIANPGKIFPVAVNIGINVAKGDYIFIAGAHAKYPSNYISECINYSLKYDADNIGGIIETVPLHDNFMGRLITTVLSSPFGVGNSKFRTGSSEIIETDTVFGGCYKSIVFRKYGMFNENLVSTSDYEFNRRIKKAGARILLVPEIKVTYYTRTALIEFLKNNIRNGFWAIYPLLLTDHFPVSLRHLIPLIFTLSLISTICLGFISKYFIYLFLAIIILYLIVCLFFSVKAVGKKVVYVLALPTLFISLHLTYGIGSIWGVVNVIHKRFFKHLKS